MMLYRFIFRKCRGMMLATTIAALLSGACNAGLIALVNQAINEVASPARWLIISFVALGLGKVATNYASQFMLASFSQGIIAGLRQDLVRKILGVPLRKLEELGTHRLLVALTDDVFNITQALMAIPIAAVNLAILLGGAAYMGWLSWRMLAAAGILILVGAVGYRFLVSSAFHRLAEAREEEDKLFRHFHALTDGIKELKLHRARRRQFLDRHVQGATELFQRHNVAAENRFILAQNWSHLLYFALIGVILFVIPGIIPLTRETLTGYVITTLYLMGPLAGIMSSFSLFGRANVALKKISDLGVSLSEQAIELTQSEAPELNTSFKKLEIQNVVHSYHLEQEDSNFVLGPINLTFVPGEVVFLIGGNGSGKSTLAKIITGLYLPEAGEIRLDGRLVTHQNRDDYRQLFSAVFVDFYLFENLMGLGARGLDDRARDYLRLFHLHHKVKINEGVLSTTAVSQGQRKRLALLTAYLEDRPFYLFDEWAADQDPYFKGLFYTQLLPELKARGKTVLVITHDEKYFGLADRTLKLDYGRLVACGEEARDTSESLLVN
jgi:putative ATP-binding cassette transporter